MQVADPAAAAEFPSQAVHEVAVGSALNVPARQGSHPPFNTKLPGGQSAATVVEAAREARSSKARRMVTDPRIGARAALEGSNTGYLHGISTTQQGVIVVVQAAEMSRPQPCQRDPRDPPSDGLGHRLP